MDVVVVPGERVVAERHPILPVPLIIDRLLPDDPVDVRFAFVVKQLVEYLLPDRRIYRGAPPGAVPNVEANMVVIPCYFCFGRVINICIAPHVVVVYEVPGPPLNIGAPDVVVARRVLIGIGAVTELEGLEIVIAVPSPPVPTSRSLYTNRIASVRIRGGSIQPPATVRPVGNVGVGADVLLRL